MAEYKGKNGLDGGARVTSERGFAVNFTIALIFKGILETWNPAQNEEKIAKKLRRRATAGRLNHTGIKHHRHAYGLYASFMETGAGSRIRPHFAGDSRTRASSAANAGSRSPD